MTEKRKKRNERNEAFRECVDRGEITPRFYHISINIIQRHLAERQYSDICQLDKDEITQRVIIKINDELGVLAERHVKYNEIALATIIVNMVIAQVFTWRRANRRRLNREEQSQGVSVMAVKHSGRWRELVAITADRLSKLRRSERNVFSEAEDLLYELIESLTEKEETRGKETTIETELELWQKV
jgi:hypothetical protein